MPRGIPGSGAATATARAKYQEAAAENVPQSQRSLLSQ